MRARNDLTRLALLADMPPTRSTADELLGAVGELALDCTIEAQTFTTVAKQEAGH